MKIKEYLSKYEVKEHFICIEGKECKYIEAKYAYEENEFLKFYIFDCIDNKICEEVTAMWDNYEKFENFQRLLLEDVFFKSVGDSRYNIYLVLIVSDNSKLLKNNNIRNDFKYARKILLTKNEVNRFFDELFPLCRYSDNAYVFAANDKKEIVEILRTSYQKAHKYLMQEGNAYLALSKKDKKQNRFDFLSKALYLIHDIEECLKLNKKEKTVQSKHNNSSNECQIQKIDSVFIKSYRCFEKEVEIPFKKINLIYGENGVGKTSLLEAIELGITGLNRRSENKKGKIPEVRVRCKDKNNHVVTLLSNENNSKFSEYWYGVKADGRAEFANLFSKCNYFDTSWASSFAIDGQNQVKLLQKFLGIDDIESAEIELIELYVCIINLIENNIKLIKNAEKRIDKKSGFNFAKNIWSWNELIRMKLNSETALSQCRTELQKLKIGMKKITLESILSKHLQIIEEIFGLLVSSNEYETLKIQESGLTAIRNGVGEGVPMSKMSTGQKVCLALAFMFALFLSYEHAPNIIMLDEPVANLDDLHMLNLLDVLRRLAISDTQIFFTTANPDVAKLFRRKFSIFGREFRVYKVNEEENKVKISYEEYSMKEEEPILRGEL